MAFHYTIIKYIIMKTIKITDNTIREGVEIYECLIALKGI